MKLSIAWIFDHINADYTKFDIPQLVQKFNLTTAEIEHVEKVSCDVDTFTLAQVSKINADSIVLHSKEYNKNIELPFRADCLMDNFYLLIQEDNNWRWARMKDWNSSKDSFLPAFSCTDSSGTWKKYLVTQDYILHVDNKSITNRPDLWSHKGFAREIAAILNLPLADEKSIFAQQPVIEDRSSVSQSTGNPFSFQLEDSDYCKRFGALYIANIGHYASWLSMAQRLCNVDVKPIDAIVDTTNYVMFDIGQPLHAFDAEKINSKNLVPRLAHQGQTLQLLDDQIIELTEQDIVITNGKKPIALGGIMGGKETAINPETRSILVEAANFDAATIRKTAQRFKLRTDASTRFEKTIDPNLNVLGLLRFLKILEEYGIPLITASDIISLGKAARPGVIEITHKKIEESLGVSLSQEFIQKTLQALGCTIEIIRKDNQDCYRITVPTFRSTKDIQIPEDIIEEIGRFYGYGNIPQELPKLATKAHSLHDVVRVRQIRQYMAGAVKAREVYNYAFFDESFLRELRWEPEQAVRLVNPVSHNWQILVTSLIPHLFKSVLHAGTHDEELRFFEWGRTWNYLDSSEIEEHKSLAGIMYHKKESVDFYWAKEQLDGLFNTLGISVTWEKYDGLQPWYHPYKTATLFYKNQILGYAGIINSTFAQHLLEGQGFIFELSGDILLASRREQEEFKVLGKYQDSWFDISMLIPLEISVKEITTTIQNIDKRIRSVDLIDFFEKEEWVDQRSVTIRVVIQDSEKTLTHEDIDHLYQKVVKALHKYGAEIR